MSNDEENVDTWGCNQPPLSELMTDPTPLRMKGREREGVEIGEDCFSG